MKVVTPIEITDGKLTSTNMTETDEADWLVGTTYAVSDLVQSTATHTIYRCIAASTGDDPDVEIAAFADPLIVDPAIAHWQIISATNIWKLFDEKPSDLCTNTTSIYAKVTPSEIVGGIGVFGVVGTELTIKMTDPVEGVVYDETIDMQDETVVVDWYTWWFEPIVQLPEYVAVDLPPYTDAFIEITITNTGGTAACGQIVLGSVFSIGNMLVDGSGWSILDYSYVDTDNIYGSLYAVQRNATRLSDFDIVFDTGISLSVDNKLRSLRGGVPAIWVGSNDHKKAAQNYGILMDARPYYQEGEMTRMTVKIQGLV